MLKDILLISIGSISAIIGGFFSMWYQAKKARKLRFEELVGEKMVDACSKALSLILEVRKRLRGDSTENALRYIKEKTFWVNENRAFLPDQFYNTWYSIYRNARHLTDAGRTVEESTNLDSNAEILAKEAQNILLNKLGLKPFEWINIETENNEE